jgi:hypothetical protein
MGRRKAGDGEQEEKPPKPKKIFIATFEMWDDGEISHDLVEKVQGERGAPKSWRLDPPEFMASVKARLSENKMKILAEICKGLSISEEEIKTYYNPNAKAARASLTDTSDRVSSHGSTYDEVEASTPKHEKNGSDEFDFDSK